MSLLTRLTVTETKLFFREPFMAVFALAAAPILLLILGAIPAFRQPEAALGGLRVIDIYIPILVAVTISVLGITVLPQQLAAYREKGILRRLRTTPVQPGNMLIAQSVMCALISIVTIVLVLTIAYLIFDVELPHNVAGYVLASGHMILAIFAVGILVAALVPNAKSATAVGLVVFFPLLFFAGLWIPHAAMHPVLRAISDFTPSGAGAQALQDATAGAWPQLLHVAVMLCWTIVAGWAAAKFFRWE